LVAQSPNIQSFFEWKAQLGKADVNATVSITNREIPQQLKRLTIAKRRKLTP